MRSVIEIAKVEGSGLLVVDFGGILAGGTGMYVEILDNLEVFWTEYSVRGPSGV